MVDYILGGQMNTSLLAFESIKSDLGKRQLQVYKGFKKLEYATNSMVSKYLNLPINSTTPRTHELRKKGLIERSHISKCPITKNTAQYWKINDLNKGGNINGISRN